MGLLNTVAGLPVEIAVAAVVTAVLLLLCVVLSRTLGSRGLPVVLLFLAIGMLAGSEGFGGIEFADYRLAFQVGSLALALILFDGGLNTSARVVRRNIGPASVLATAGVAITAGTLGFAAWLLGFGWMEALLLGAVISSTDAAAVFSILRGSGVSLKQRVGATLELESGLNDPMAVILTIALTEAILTGEGLTAWLLGEVAVQLAVGAVGGWLIGKAGRRVLEAKLFAGGLYPVLTVAICALAYGLPTIALGSGFLAVYVAGVVIGNGHIPYRGGILRIHDFLAWFAQIVMFLTLGLLAFPSEVFGVLDVGLVLAAVLVFFARPLAVVICMLPFGFKAREVVLLSWVGLRGAVPIVLAIIPVLAGIDGGHRIINIVFFVVVASALVQGSTVKMVTKLLRLDAPIKPVPPATIEIASQSPLDGDLLSFHITPTSAVCGATLKDVPFPEGAAAMLIVRDRKLIAPRGTTELLDGDHVFVFCQADDRPLLSLLFGMAEDGEIG